MKTSIISLCICLLFILTVVNPMTLGYDVDSKVKSTYDEHRLEDYYGVYNLEEIPERIRPTITDDSENTIASVEIDASISKESINPLQGPPMDSPWPMYCHDVRHTSRSPHSTADNPGDEIWRIKDKYDSLDGGTIIDRNGTIYYGTFDIFAVYSNGTRKWKYDLWGYVRSTPAIDNNGIVYVGNCGYGNYLWAFYPNGSLYWKFKVGDWIYSSPAIANDGIIYFGSEDEHIYAVFPNGTLRWKYKTDHVVLSSPAIGGDGTIYCGSHDQHLYALNPNGTLKWRFPTKHWIRTSPCIADDGTVYCVSLDNHLYALNPNGTLKWKTDVGAGTSPTIGQDGTIYCGYSKLHAVNPNNGTLKWIFNPGKNRAIRGSTPGNSVDGTIYFGANINWPNGGAEIIALDSNGHEKWRKHIGDYIEIPPAIASDEIVYVASNTHLYAFGRGDLEGDANGPYYELVDEPVHFTGYATGGYRPHSYYWDFGDGNTSIEQNPAHTYTTPDNYTVTLTVADNTNNTTMDSTFAWIQDGNTIPNQPSIDGPFSGKKGTRYNYTFLTTEPDGSVIWYYIDWGDDKDTGWIGPYDSGSEIIRSHKWKEKDTYTIRCKAKDPYDAESDWGELDIEIPRTRTSSYLWYHWFLERFPLLEKLLNLLR